MNASMIRFLDSLVPGRPQHNGHLTVFPLFTAHGPELDYLTFGEAMQRRMIKVKEVSEAGRVNCLVLHNKAKLPVLILGGEEIKGVKQNRVLNTTVMMAAGHKLALPVSCSERHRWSRESRRTRDSGHLLHREARYLSMKSVAYSRIRRARYESDQMGLWNLIERMQRILKNQSPTSALSDVYESLRQHLERDTRHFPLIRGQIGILVLIDGKPAGLDIISRPAAYASLHWKLLRSYLLDFRLHEVAAHLDPAQEMTLSAQADHFLEWILTCSERIMSALDMGQEWHYTGDNLVGMALAVDDAVVHASFFPEHPQHWDTGDEYEGIRVGAAGSSSPEGEGAGGAEGPDACPAGVRGVF